MAGTAERQQVSENRLKAMAHPLRRAILRYLIEHGTRAPVEIAIALEEELGDVSYHMRRLAAFGMVEAVREEKVRGTIKHYFRHTDLHLVDTDEWNELDPVLRRGLLVDFAQPAVDDFTTAVRDGALGKDGDFHITRTPLHGMDREGLGEAMEIHKRAFEEILELPARCAQRMAETGEEPISVSSSQWCFEVPNF
jgi:DNA-binding transcriptional ArsR family regulator